MRCATGSHSYLELSPLLLRPRRRLGLAALLRPRLADQAHGGAQLAAGALDEPLGFLQAQALQQQERELDAAAGALQRIANLLRVRLREPRQHAPAAPDGL